MACAMCAVYEEESPDTSHISRPEMNPLFGFKQVMIASEWTHPVVTPNYNYSQPYSEPFSGTGTVQTCIL